jgi:AcrR family transcriptional regulator
MSLHEAAETDAKTPGRKKSTRDPDRTRASVLASATKEFVAHGLSGARIDRIARRASVNKQMIYYYFGSKEALYLAVLDAAYAALRAAESRLNLEALDPVDGIRELALFNWRYHAKHPELISLVRTENLHKAKYLKRSRQLQRLNSPLLAAISDVLRRGAESGAFRDDADPVEVYMTIAALGSYYIGNHWTLEANFRRDLLAPARLDAWGRHIVEIVLAYLQRRPV